MDAKILRQNKEIILLIAVGIAVRASTTAAHLLYGLPTVLNIPSPFIISPWNDFDKVYVGWLQSLSHGLVPYSNIPTYKLTPLFLYILYPFYLAGGATGASVPIWVLDAATSPLVYLLVKRLGSGRIALIAGLGYALSPFALFYEGYLWMSSQPMTFFIMLAVYLTRGKRLSLSALSMGLAVMVKQEALFLLPAYGVWYAWRHGKSVLKGLAVLLMTLFAISLPFLLINPIIYLEFLNYVELVHVTSTSTLSTGVVQNCTNQLIEGITVAVCGNATSGLSAFVESLHPNFAAFVLDTSSRIVAPILFFVVFPALLVSRKEENFFELFSAYSIIGFLTAYLYLGYPLLRYYYLPVYALLLASAKNYRCLLVGILAPIVSLFLLPENAVQAVLPLLSLLAVLAMQGQAKVAAGIGPQNDVR